jgi:hypothetical protein
MNKADAMIEDCINALCDDDINKGAEALTELAKYWNKAGLTMQSFLDMRIYIINMAKEKTDAIFIDEKLKLSEKALREKRTGTPIIINH